MNHTKPTPLKVVVHLTPLPKAYASDERLSVGLQSGTQTIVRGTRVGDGIHFTTSVTVRRDKEGQPDFFGPLVHGKRHERFLYVSWGEGDREAAEHEMFRRLKIFFTPVTRKNMTIEGIDWALVNCGAVVATTIGVASDGSPACGTASLLWKAED